jgi:hypothetical protein
MYEIVFQFPLQKEEKVKVRNGEAAGASPEREPPPPTLAILKKCTDTGRGDGIDGSHITTYAYTLVHQDMVRKNYRDVYRKGVKMHPDPTNDMIIRF